MKQLEKKYTAQTFTFAPESFICAMAGLLTYSRFELPSHFTETVAFEYSNLIRSLQQRVLLSIFTTFPFHSVCIYIRNTIALQK